MGLKKEPGAPRKYNRKKLLAALLKYTEEEDVPSIAEFSYQQRIARPYLYEMAAADPRLSDALEMLRTKKEAQLEKGGLSGELNVSMAALALKQLGWRERSEIETKGEAEVKGTIEIRIGKEYDNV